MPEPLELPLELPEPPPGASCWYCGGKGQLEREHQRPVSRGGKDGLNIVSACGRCNDLKGPLNLEEFRQGLAERLGLDPGDVVFAGEASPERPATPRIASVRSLGAEQSVVRLDPAVGEELEAAWRYLRSTGSPRLTRRDLASAGIANYLAALRDELLDGAESWPEPNLSLFDPEARPQIHGRTDLSRTPRVPMPRQHTKVPGDLLDWARAGVEHRRASGEAELTLLDWMQSALRRALEADARRFPDYPTLEDALNRRYGSRDPV